MAGYTIPVTCELLPCNVVVRSTGDRTTLVEAFDPGAMMRLADRQGALEGVAARAGQQLREVLGAVPAGPGAGISETAKEK